jgi:hypothetical protein
VVTQCTPEELRAAGWSQSSFLEAERRVNEALGRADFKCNWLAKVEEVGPSANGLSFQEFRKVYKPRRLFFRDIFSQDGFAEVAERVSRAQFELEGGAVQLA